MNPLLKKPLVDDTHLIPFDEIKDEHFAPALEEGIQRAKAAIAKISADQSAPNFKNTIEAIEFHKEDIERIALIFMNLVGANTNDTLQALAKEISPQLSALSNDLLLDGKIFARVKAAYDNRAQEKLSPEQAQLLEKTYKAFRRNGALLDEAGKNKLRKIDGDLARLAHEYSDHILKATNEYILFVEDEAALKELPANALEEAKELAKEKNRGEAWAFTMQYPSTLPFMQHCTREDLRKELSLATASKCMSGPHDNRQILRDIAKLRFERAELLGYKHHADFVLEERMAAKPEKVESFLRELASHSRPAAEKDLAELRQLKKKMTGQNDINPWDVAFYSERLKKAKFDFSSEELRPYFQLENVIKGVFEHARILYGIKFKERADIPVYHPDVKAFEVTEEGSDRLVGYFYADFFPRASKRAGAWMTNYLEQGMWDGKVRRPHVSIVCNFTKPTATQPSLLTLDEVRTLFHEFGHGLHSLLTDCTYVSLAGTNVFWDFVELPSQIMENWATEQSGLELFAHHYQTGAPMPKELIEKIKASSTFQSGWMSLRQLSLATLDMAWHARDPSEIIDIEAFEQTELASMRFFPAQPGTSVSAAFSHIFAGGYSAGYYSYKWAEVLDADAFEFFKQKGIFSREVADLFRKFILSRGGTEHPMELYKKFRGREPDPKALLRRDGLIPA
ncbi:MAG: M3 family metallopeptidase [Bacteriovoracia bacterium]